MLENCDADLENEDLCLLHWWIPMHLLIFLHFLRQIIIKYLEEYIKGQISIALCSVGIISI